MRRMRRAFEAKIEPGGSDQTNNDIINKTTLTSNTQREDPIAVQRLPGGGGLLTYCRPRQLYYIYMYICLYIHISYT